MVIEENHSYGTVLRDRSAHYFRHLAHTGVNFTNFREETHPSQPNYLALFAGRTFGADDSCPLNLHSHSLASQMADHHLGFAGYSEGLPRRGWLGCFTGAYLRRHAPWTNFGNVHRGVGRSFAAFPRHYGHLPAVSFVIPNLNHDMHDGTVTQADRWLRHSMGGYISWARTHHSLFVVTFDETDYAGTRIPTIAVGQGLGHHRSGQRIDHYNLLRTIENGLHLPPIGAARHARAIRALR